MTTRTTPIPEIGQAVRVRGRLATVRAVEPYSIVGSTSLPSVDANRPDDPKALQAFVNAHRWTRLNRLREKDGLDDEPLLGVWNSAIQVHPYQLEPVIRGA